MAECAGRLGLRGAFSVARAMWSALDEMEENFRTGGGLEWGRQHPCLFEGTERFFRAGYIGNLIGSWIPALDRVQAKLAAGAKGTDYPGTGYDLVAHFDCLHDIEDPAGAARHARTTLAKDGTWLIVEPFSSDKAEENHNPVGRIYYSASTMPCVPHSLSRTKHRRLAQAARSRALAGS